MRNLAVFLAMVISSAPSAAPGVPLRFSCAVTGERHLEPPATAATICETMRASLGKAAGIALRTDPNPIADDDRNGWMRVTLVFTKAGVASAKLERAEKNRVFVYPFVNVAVSDRGLDLQVVDILARELARAIDAGTANG
jgi:hypothetical protein